MKPQRPAPRYPLGGRERTPRWLAWNLLQPLPCWIHPPPRTSQYTIGCQPSTTTNLHVLLGEDLHLQARLDDSHGRGAKYAGDVDKSSFSRRLFFGFSSHWLFSSRSCGWLSPTLSNWRLRLDFCHGGGWTTASFILLPHVSQSPLSPCSTGSEGRISCEHSEFCRQHTYNCKSRTRLPYSKNLPLEM
jgi:hypothetical protein